MITINFTGNINNDSLQIGDLAYYVTPSESGGFNQSTQNPILIGPIEAITLNTIDVDNGATGEEPAADDFIMFAKDSRINLSGLVGYYADVEFKNKSRRKIELFSVGSEIFESSK